ncbi:MAG: DoxX family protein [Phycisphaeraceae bacterium]
MTKTPLTQDIGLLVLRATLGLYLLIAGIGKVRGEFSNGVGSFYKGKGFQGLQPDWLPDAFAAPYGYALPWLEVIVGALLIVGLLGRFAAIGGFLMLASFTIVKVESTGSITGLKPDEVGSFNANYIQSAAYLLLVLAGCGRIAVDTLVFKKRKGGA